MLVGSAVLGATLLLGYAFGQGDKVEKVAHKTLASARADTKAPSIVKKKLEEAKETASSLTAKSSSSSLSSTKTTPPAVSSTGATEPAPSIEEDNVSVTSSLSDPGSLSSSSSEANAAEDDEEEDPRQAAFNPETGEINWDCPCLGGMAHGVCGEQFREAFSCFVYSKEEPKGQDCIEKFRGMQECFAAHPEVYGEVMGDDEEEDFEATSAPRSSYDESEYDVISAVEKALTGEAK